MAVIILAVAAVVVVWLQVCSLRQITDNSTGKEAAAKNKKGALNKKLLIYCLLMGTALALSALQLFDIQLSSPLSLIEFIFTPVSDQITHWLGLS